MIPNGAFLNCTNLITASFPSTLEEIGSDAFSRSGLTSLNLSGTSVTKIGMGAFYSSLTTASFPSTLEEIGDFAFYESGLTSLNLSGTSVTKIGSQAIEESTNLKKSFFN